MEDPAPLRVTRLVGRALEAARKVLRDLDHDQVPAALRRVVAHSGDLTPPLANLLVRELGAAEWLREKAADAWPEADTAPAAHDRASALFLKRPPGWEVDLALEASALGASAALAGSNRSERSRSALERDLGAAKERERQARARAEEAEAAARELRRRTAEPVRADRAEAARIGQEMERSRARWEADRADLAAKAEAAEAGIADLRESLYRVERDRADLARRLEEARGGAEWAARDPVALAALVDETSARARAARRESTEPAGPTPASVTLPPGVRPDEARAIDAVLAHEGPLLVIVDGYNVGLKMTAGSPAEVRARLSAVLDRLVVIAPTRLRVSVVWDSSLGDAAMKRRGRLEVRFAAAGEEADDVVVATARDADVPAVVISSDREVRDRSEAVGALALWSDALVAWGAGRR
jgi:hypothetical protein